jgi:hypothetical protein
LDLAKDFLTLSKLRPIDYSPVRLKASSVVWLFSAFRYSWEMSLGSIYQASLEFQTLPTFQALFSLKDQASERYATKHLGPPIVP